MRILYELLKQKRIEVLNYFLSLDTLTLESFFKAIGYEINLIFVIVWIILLLFSFVAILGLPIFISWCIKAILLITHAQNRKKIAKIHLAYRFDDMYKDVYHMSSEPYSVNKIKRFYRKWMLIRKHNFSPEQLAFDDLLKKHKNKIYEEKYCKNVADFIKKHEYAPIIAQIEKSITLIEKYVDNKINIISTILWILWALLLWPIVITLFV